MEKEFLFPFLCILLAIVSALLMGCNTDKLAEPDLSFCDSLQFNLLTYDNEIRPIIVTKCLNDGCHVSEVKGGDYRNYNSLKIDLDNGKFFDKVMIERAMPEIGSPDLTAEEFSMFQCWLDNDYPEK